MSWYQPNGGPQQNGGHPYGQPSNDPQQNNMSQIAPYAALGGSVQNVGNNQAHAYDYSAVSGGAGQNTSYYAMGQSNNNPGFSYSTLGTYGAMGNGSQMQPAGNYDYASMGVAAPAPSAYGSFAAAQPSGNAQQVVWPWNANTPQHQQQQYSQQGYPGQSYNQSQPTPAPSYLDMAYSANEINGSGFHQQQLQRPQHMQVAIPPPPPPPPASYLDKDGMQGDLAASARRERTATREDVPKKPPPPAPRPPPEAPNPPTANVPANVVLTDSAVSAISALSNLDQQWSSKEVGKKERRKAKRKRQRSRKKKNAANKGGSSAAAGDGGKEGVWIDVEHEPPAKKQQKGTESQEAFDLNAGVESNSFPPLAPPKSKEGDNSNDDAARLADISTSQLTSYAAVLGRALEQEGDGVDPAPNSQAAQMPENDDNDEEMDISDGEEEVEVVDLTADDAGADSQPAPKPSDDDATEKEQRALKLAELRAKAKLARAKLRIAEQKKARGSASRESLESSKDDESSSKLSAAPRPSHPVATSAPPAKLAIKPVLTALRNIGSLVIEDVSATGPADEVRFVDSVYRQPKSKGDRAVLEGELSTSRAPARTGISPTPPSMEDSRKKSESLKQQLHLARLQLEIKKKELRKKELEKKKEAGALDVDPSGSTVAHSDSNPATLQEDVQASDAIDTSIEATDDKPSADQAHAKLDELRRRQKELKQKNDIASLRNIVHRQRDLLQAQGKELSESSSQLQSCVDSIKTKQALLDKSEQKLEELHHRKRIMEGMVFRATEQLMAARKALNERRQRKNG